MEIQRRKGRPITTTQAAPMIKYSIYTSLLLLTPHHEGARQTVVVSLLQNGQGADGGGHAAGLSYFHVVLVVGVLVHGAHGLEVTGLAGGGRHVLLHLLTTTHHRAPSPIRRKLADHDGVLHVEVESLLGPLVIDRHVVHIPRGETTTPSRTPHRCCPHGNRW